MQIQNYDNVILFGAGASADAGIPMLDSFLDKMWEYAIRGKVGNSEIAQNQKQIFEDAIKIRKDLEPFNSRAFFDNRNIEDVLSLLSFEALSDGNRSKYELMVKAVALTIELSCHFKYSSERLRLPLGGTDYHGFWHCLLQTPIKSSLPALITFNYDLVLERTLWEHFHYINDDSKKRITKSAQVLYHYGIYDFTIRGISHRYNITLAPHPQELRYGELAQFDCNDVYDVVIPYLKLHGSLNWDERIPNKKTTSDGNRLRPTTPPTQTVETPLILPPVFNKVDAAKIDDVWKVALQILRKAKNIIIVGYSLPKTDIYMQYFLKSAVGPNSDLQKIIIFDPILFTDSEKGEQMKQRYRECFSPQFNNRIIFQPKVPAMFMPELRGTFRHFVEILRTHPADLLF